MKKLKVGAAKRSISPTDDMLPFPENVIFGNRKYTWVRNEIYMRVIALDNGEDQILFMTQEHGAPTNTGIVKEEISRKYGIAPENIFISGTHNHSCPPPSDLSKTEEWGLPIPEVRHEYSRYVIKQAVEAAGEALENMRPARFGFGKGNSYINVNRDEYLESGRYVEGRNFERPSDKTLAVLKFEDYDGKLIAAMLNYSVHSVMCFRVVDKDGNLCVSGDLAGEITDFVEKAYEDDDAVVAWTIAAGGNQNPLFSCFHNYFPDGTYVLSKIEWDPIMWDIAHHLGMRQGMDALRILRSIEDMQDEVEIKTLDKTIDLPGTKVEGFTKPMIMDANLIDDSKIFHVDADPIPMQFKLIKLNDLVVMGMQCELMCEIGMRLKQKVLPQEMMIISLFEQSGGGRYFVDKWGYQNKTFAYYRNKVKDACFEDEATKTVVDMINEISG